MNAQDKIRAIREQALLIKKEREQEKEIVVVEEKPVETLPQPFKAKPFLSVKREGGLATKEDLLDKFSIEPEVYEAIEVTEEQGKKINKALGRMVTGVSAAVPILCRGESCSYKEACITGDSLILTKKGLVKIEDIKEGSLVYSFNTETCRIESDKVIEKATIGKKKVFKVFLRSGNVIRVTDNHPFLAVLSDGTLAWKSLRDGLKEGSEVLVIDSDSSYEFSENMGDSFIDRLIKIEEGDFENVFDITIETNKNFVANNIIVHNCPFYEENAHVLGEKCPIEVALIEAWANDFMEELNIDPNSITEIQILSRLVEISILERRLTVYISIHDQDLTSDFITSVDPEMGPITNKGPSIAFEQREKLDRAKMKLLESLNATRERKIKIQQQIQAEAKVDTSMLDIRDTVIDIAKALKMQNVVGES